VSADLADPAGFVDDLLALGAGLEAPGVLLATHDEALSAVGPREDELASLFRRPWSGWPTMERVLDKSHQHAVARSIGFPVPETREPTDEADLVAAARSLRFPVILKPRNLQHWLPSFDNCPQTPPGSEAQSGCRFPIGNRGEPHGCGVPPPRRGESISDRDPIASSSRSSGTPATGATT
jgi:hypothetical protein